MILETNIFWIFLFIFQILILNILSKQFHGYLSLLTGLGSGGGKVSQKIFGLFLFLGTLVHELSHILMAAILFVRVKALNLKTELVEDKHIRLGTAEVELVDPFRNALVGIAPLLFGVVLIYFLALGIDLQNLSWWEVLKLLFISQISNSMFLSKSDTVYFKYVFILFIVIGILFWLANKYFNFLNIAPYINSFNSFLFKSDYIIFLKNINLVFLFVIIFNLGVNLFLKFLSKYKRY